MASGSAAANRRRRGDRTKRRWSYLLQEFTQMLAVDSAYEQAMHNLGQILGGRFSVDTAENINAEMGQAAGEFLSELPAPPCDSEQKLLVASAACKGVPLVKEDAAKVAAFEKAKKNPGNRRMATVDSGIHVAMVWIMGQIALRRRAGQVLIVLMDGQESLWETMKLQFWQRHASTDGS